MESRRTGHLQHELRTPLNHLIGYADLMLEEEDLAGHLREALVGLRELAAEALDAIPRFAEDAAPSPESLQPLTGVVARLQSHATSLGVEATSSFAEEIQRIQSAAARLQQVVADLGSGNLPDPVPAEEPHPGEPTPPPRQVILVVDDDETNRDVLRRRLARLGYGVTEAANGRQALDILAREDIDLVLLDLIMPELDGLAVLERLRDDDRLRGIPVIMISAHDDMESVVRCIELGAQDYLPKPFDPVLLQARIGACMERKQLHDRERELLTTVTRQADELRAWNLELEERVRQKVVEVERLSLMRRFVPPQLADAILAGGDDLLKSHRREIAVLFCDLRGFTPFSESAEPEDVMAVLSELHDAVGPLIFDAGGTLAQFSGDGLMVFFNDPIPCDEPPWSAVTLALAMRDRAATLSEQWSRRGHNLQLGVGLSLGHATCGQIGFHGRYEYTAIGTVINLASRLCDEAAGGQILASARVIDALEGRVVAESVGDLSLKGFARPVPAFAITALTTAS